MDSAGDCSSPLYTFKSKRVLCSSVNKQHSADEAVGAPDLSPWSSKTSEKPKHPPQRSLTRRKVSQAAKRLRKLNLKPSVSSDPIRSSETLITKPNTSKALEERRFDEVVEEMLPEQRVTSSYPKLDMTYAVSQQQPVDLLHSFKRFLSNKNAEAVDKKLPEAHLIPDLKKVSDHSSREVACVSIGKQCPIKSFDLGKKGDISSIVGTPRELILAACTPAAPRKMFPTEITIRKQSKCRGAIVYDTKMPPVKRDPSDYDDELDALFASIREKIRKPIETHAWKRSRKLIETKDSAISQAEWRKQMIARLPKLFDILLNIFLVRPVMSKKELLHIIILGHMSSVEQREVDEQLSLMLELAPEWIQAKMASSGDLLICVNKISSPESIRTRLSEAK